MIKAFNNNFCCLNYKEEAIRDSALSSYWLFYKATQHVVQKKVFGLFKFLIISRLLLAIGPFLTIN